jgi:hypothetical protein
MSYANQSLPMSVLDADIAAFQRMLPTLEAQQPRAWVVFRGGKYVDAYPDFESAAEAACELFDAGPYLIRQVGAPSQIQLPGGMIFTRANDQSLRGI